MTKYCIDNSSGTVDNKKELDPGDDVATVTWGINWQMPSNEQFLELTNSNYTTIKWTGLNGKNGIKITSKLNENSIFLPACGSTNGVSNKFVVYWSRSLYEDISYYAIYMHCQQDINICSINGAIRCEGFSVRPVRKQ